MKRRDLLKLAGGAAGAGLAGWPSAASSAAAARRHLKVLVAGGHPDDPESGCGGTIARYSDAGHEVVALYLTRGEAGIPGTPPDEAARIRTAEAQAACEVLKARPVFAGQIDGGTEVTPAWYDRLRELVAAERPDLILTHWPVDTHRDHRAASLLVYDAWLRMEPKPALYFFEVLTGWQTQAFHPTDYVDITATAERKRAAVHAHASQTPDEWYPAHERMSTFRGLECGCTHAEGFVRHDQSPPLPLLR
jgi:LmbE family N-acetylglucosaminyl deacetylase